MGRVEEGGGSREGVGQSQVSETDRQTPHSADISGIELNTALTFSLGVFSSPHRQHFL